LSKIKSSAKKVVVEDELVVCLHLLWLLLAAGCLLLNFDMTATTHKLQVNKHTTMKIEWRNSIKKSVGQD
jgi:hypothetical protein